MYPAFPDKHTPLGFDLPNPKGRGTTKYIVGHKESTSVVGITHCPFGRLYDALNVIPLSKRPYFIFHCDNIDILPLYIWHKSKDIWRRIKPKRVWAFHAESTDFVICMPEELETGELDYIGEAITYQREELREYIVRNPYLISTYKYQEETDIPF